MMEKTKIKEYKELFDNLKNGNQYYRLGKLFSTTEKKYFYDTGTGKIFEIADRVYEVLDAIFDEDTLHLLNCYADYTGQLREGC